MIKNIDKLIGTKMNIHFTLGMMIINDHITAYTFFKAGLLSRDSKTVIIKSVEEVDGKILYTFDGIDEYYVEVNN